MRWPVFAVVRFVVSRDLPRMGDALMKKWFIFIACLWAVQASAQGTYRAATCNLSDVSAAIAAEQAKPLDGDIISIPAGRCTWTGNLNVKFTNSVTIQGAGAISATTGGAGITGSDLTALINHNGTNPIMTINAIAGKSLRITGIAFLEDSGGVATYNGFITLGGQSSAFRIDHCHFFILFGGSHGPGIGGGLTGVIDHIYIDTKQGLTTDIIFNNGQSWQGVNDGYGNKVWNDGDHFGTGQFMYVEDSRFVGGGMTDCSSGRYVFRYNTILESQGFYNHGTHTQYRSCRAAEFYHNVFSVTTFQPDPIQHNGGGTTLFWGNSITGRINGDNGYSRAVDLGDTRVEANYGNPSGYPYPPNGWGLCGKRLQTNGLTETSPWDGNSNATTGYPCMDAPARGAGDLLTTYNANGDGFLSIINTATGTRTWPHQVLSPVYIWNNTLTRGILPYGLVGTTDGMLANNRDYYMDFGSGGNTGSFNGTSGIGQGLLSARPSTCTAGTDPMTGSSAPGVGFWATDKNTLYVCNPTNTWTAYYTPYTYPHPLTQQSSTGATGATVTPPTGLAATVQ
jgi:hypothetical protein